MGKCYEHNFVFKVIAKIDFAQPFDLFSNPTVVEGLNLIKDRFPISEQAKGVLQNIQVSQEGPYITEKNEFPEWIFNSIDRTKTLKFNKLFIEVLLTKYNSEKDFKEDLILPIS